MTSADVQNVWSAEWESRRFMGDNTGTDRSIHAYEREWLAWRRERRATRWER